MIIMTSVAAIRPAVSIRPAKADAATAISTTGRHATRPNGGPDATSPCTVTIKPITIRPQLRIAGNTPVPSRTGVPRG